jgi:hypothetical protein
MGGVGALAPPVSSLLFVPFVVFVVQPLLLFGGPMRAYLLTALAVALLAGAARADAFDHYINPVLDKLVEGKNVKEVKQLTSSMIVDHDAVLPRSTSAFLVVKTNGNRYAKLLVQAGKQKVGADKALPVLIVNRFVTYKDGEEQAIQASGKDLSLYEDFRLSLDLGQVVPKAVGGDLRFVVDKDGKSYTEPLGKAKLYVVTKHDPKVMPKKGAKFVIGEKFEARYFNGTFKLQDDGRRAGKLVLKVGEDNKEITGWYYSAKDGSKYEVKGKVGVPIHSVELTVKFPRTEQVFKGMMFTGDGKAMAGTSKMVEREAAWYAVREE